MRLNIRKKLLIITTLLLLLPSLTIGMVSYYSASDHLNTSGETTIQNAVEMALQLIDSMDQQVKSGQLTLEEAQEQVKVYLLGERQADGTRPVTSTIDLGKNGYFVIYDQEGLEVAHPTIEGENVWDVQDREGQFLVQNQIQAALDGGGFTTYAWAFPDNPDRIGDKIMYNALDPNWGWVVTAGSYMEDFNEGSQDILWTVVITTTIALIVGIIFSVLFANHISRPIKAIRTYLVDLSQNKLNMPDLVYKRQDEINDLAESLNLMKNNLSDMIGKISSVSHTLAASSEQLSASSEETNKATEQIASSIMSVSESSDRQSQMAQQSMNTVETIAERIKSIEESISRVNTSSEMSAERVERGQEGIQASAKVMTNIKHTTSNVSTSVHKLGEESKQIGKIINVITDIAEQTNLLALNAAIEAARAGEHGKGFAVVADEVRKLAEESSQSATDIRTLIEKIQVEIEKSVDMMKENETVVIEGQQKIDGTGKAFDAIQSATTDIASRTKEMLGAIQSISQGTTDMVKRSQETTDDVMQSASNVETVAAASEEQSASMEEIAASSESLSHMAEELSDIVNQFKL